MKYPHRGGRVLLDSFNRKHNYLRLSLTDRCNFKCQYCMPENPIFSPNSSLLSSSELDRISRLFVKTFSVNKIRLTGGEPLARKDFKDIINNFKHPDYNHVRIGITTNGLLLDRYFNDLVEANVTGFNLSIDSLVPEKFSFITRQNKKSALRVYKNFEDILLTNLDSIVLNRLYANEDLQGKSIIFDYLKI